jgi:hypothetical protein
MYYKITNTESELYKKLHELRTKELVMEMDNIMAVQEKTGHTWDRFIGYHQQTGFNRVTDYYAFEFNDGKPVDSKVWRQHKNEPTCYEPNTRTKAGREMKEFLERGLKRHSFHAVDDALGLKYLIGRFSLPYLEIEGPIIKLFLDDRHDPKFEDLIEITRTEFNEEYKEA